MRSKASYRGHPLHPVIIPFPLAFLTGAFAFDVVGVVLDRPIWWTAGAYLGILGILAGVVAAVPGAVDYFETVPPSSSGKKRATKHAFAMVAAVCLFVVAQVLRGNTTTEPGASVLVVEAVAVALIGVGGWLGGTLVNRNQIGVDHRYARAGKWQEAKLSTRAGGPLVAARVGELELDQMKLLRVDGRRIVLARTRDGYVAFDDRCPHRGGSLAGGVLMCGTVQCPWHGSQFDVRNGALQAGPAEQGLATYKLEEADDEVRLIL